MQRNAGMWRSAARGEDGNKRDLPHPVVSVSLSVWMSKFHRSSTYVDVEQGPKKHLVVGSSV